MNVPAKLCANERLHYFGKYVIRLQRKGAAFVYEVLTKSGLLVSAGFDSLSLNEKMALDGITNRLCGNSNGR